MILMKLKDVPGDSNIDQWKGWITCNNLSWAINREPKESAKGATQDVFLGVAEIQPISVQKSTDSATTALMYKAIAGGSLDTGEIVFLQSGADGKYDWFLQFKLDRVIIKSWNVSGSEDERPEETVELMYNKIWVKYRTTVNGKDYKDAGDKGWDMVAGKEWKA